MRSGLLIMVTQKVFSKVPPAAFQNVIIHKWLNEVLAIYVQLYVEGDLLAKLKPEEYDPAVYSETADFKRISKYRTRMYGGGSVRANAIAVVNEHMREETMLISASAFGDLAPRKLV